MERNYNEPSHSIFEGCVAILLLLMVGGFFGLIYYACEAYPKTYSAEVIDKDHCKIVLYLGSLCDPPAKIISEFEEKNPHVEVEGYSLSRAWNGDTILELRIKRK